MIHRLTEDARLLMWKLAECRERAIDQKIDSVALLIRAAMEELEDIEKDFRKPDTENNQGSDRS